MATQDDEVERLRAVGLLNAQSILVARLQAEEELRRQSEWLRVTLASIGDAVISTDPNGHVSYMNGVAEALTGWPLAEALGRPLPDVFAVINEFSRQPAENPALRVLREGTIVGLANHTVLIARDGTERPIDDSAAPIRDDSGNPLGAVLVFRDVSERRQAEAALRRNEAELSDFLENANVGLHWVAPDGTILRANKTELDLLGYDQDEYVGRQIAEFHVDRPVIDDILRRLLNREEVRGFEARLRCKDGSIKHVLINSNGLWAGDRFLHSRCFTQDVTDKKRADEAQARLAAIVESSEDAIASKTLEGIITSWNKGAERLFGYTAEEAVGQSITLIVPPERRDEEFAILDRLRRGERVEHFETIRQTKGGHLIDISLTVSPLRDSAGRVIGASKVARDITERKKAENALKEQDRRKDEFLAVLAHELRNPLAPLRNGLQVLRLAESDVATRASARAMMERQLAHMVRLIDDLLDISRINRNKMELRRSRIQLAEIMSNAAEVARPMIEAAGHEFHMAKPSESILVHADLTRMAQLFGNLLTNSAKYTDHGGRIEFVSERVGDEAVVSVRDNGIGIPASALPHIFEMFSQVESGDTRGTGGLGIGLALVKGLVERHGGTVTAHSDGPGKGSTFTVRLPIAPQIPEPTTSSPASEDTEPTAARPWRILVVDDNEDSAHSMAKVLKLLGNEVRTADDGVAAVEIAEQYSPELILMDMGMPQLDGYEATRRIRAQPWGKSIIIVALTGWGQEGDKARSRNAGCNHHLVKPVAFEDLELLLEQFADRRET